MSRPMTFEALLNRAASREEQKNKTLEITLPNGDTLTFKSLPESKVLQVVDEIAASDKDTIFSSSIGSTDRLIYQTCDMLQNPELHKQLGVAEPWDVVSKIFTLAERDEIGGKLLDWLGVSSITSDVKKTSKVTQS